MIILIDKIFWKCYSKRYSILYFKRGTVETPFQNIEIEKLLEWISGVLLSKIGFRELIGDALTLLLTSLFAVKEKKIAYR